MTQHRALLVGAGGMGRAWAKNLAGNPDATIAGWVDIRPGAAAQAANELDLHIPAMTSNGRWPRSGPISWWT
jgi:predicted dehydrogenase